MENNKINLIGISGKKNSGKNLIAKLINYYLTGGDKQYVSLDGFLEYYEDAREKDGSLNFPFQEKSFAAKLKQIASILTSIPVEKFEDQVFKEQTMLEEWDYLVDAERRIAYKGQSELGPPTYKELLQKIGTEVGRQIHPEVWINSLFADYKILNTVEGKTYSDLDKSNWIITDVRFPNEVKAIEDRGGIVIRVNRPGIEEDNHLSETALDNHKFKVIFDNNSTIRDLYNVVSMFLIFNKII